jgi:serine/threonine protein phosphatase 1
MRTIAIGDIHGCLTAFETLLELVSPTAEDRIITLGDYVDRGPDSAGVLDRLVAMHRAGNLVALRGNHDQMMLDSRGRYDVFERWLGYGGQAALDSYAARGGSGTLDDVPDPHWHFLEDLCVNWYETETHFFVHANAYPDIPLDEQPLFMLHYEKFDHPPRHCSGKTMICGHTSQKSGHPVSVRHAICIDTWVYGNGWLTALDVNSGKIYQANQRGESRTAWIDEFEVDSEELDE